ncbi:DUF255 domain-containing protein [Luteolibacter sp. LG18]|uniref:DUF255 domain-containing protein n=1 Tax=Luteolibacter sp. LG18 TaxID=2819286 RepID=UPI002B2FCF48|nr:hypothetical protein llg_22080 [Luteolibacter sp. LG18]
MRSPSASSRLALVATALGLVVALPSCRKPVQASASTAVPAESVPELRSNQLSDSPSTLLADQSASPVRWQPWNQRTFERAGRANRLVFAVFALPHQMESAEVMKALNSENGLIRDINENFVPVLVDSDACRETGLLAATLCAELKSPFSMPLFVWLTPEGNPVAWIPAKARKGGFRELFDQSSGLVSRMWTENAESHSYVLSNSKTDNANRAVQLAKQGECPPSSPNPDKDVLRAVRQLSSYYDAGSHSFDNAGGLFPASALEVLSSVSLMQGIPADVAGRCRAAAAGLAVDLSSSAMIDPLDGGVFSARRGGGWDLPQFTRDCSSHARALVSLAEAGYVAKNPALVAQVLSGIEFAEKNYSASNGLFAFGRQTVLPADNWLWSMEELEKVLSLDEMKVLGAVCGLKGLGNIPIESDPNREQFRRNSLAVKTPPENAAARLGMEPAAARGHFESARKKILKLRQERTGDVPEDSRPHAIASFRMVSAYAAAYAVTGDPALRKKMTETFGRAREVFSSGSELLSFPGGDDTLCSARAFLYGIAIQAALDVAEVSFDPEAAAWAGELSAAAAGRFMEGTRLREATDGQSLVKVPISDRTMIYDDSSAGLLSAVEARLSKLGQPVTAAYAAAVASLPTEAIDKPIIHADLVQAALIRHQAPLVLLAPDASAALREAVARLPLRTVSRRLATPADSVPSGQAKIVLADGTSSVASSSDMLGPLILAGGLPR